MRETRDSGWFFPLRLFLPVFAVFAFGCVSKEKREAERREVAALEHKISTGSVEARHAAVETGADLATEVTFVKGGETLTPASRQQAQGFMSSALAKGALTEVRVVAWADTEYPPEGEPAASTAERRLAERRLETLKKFVLEAVEACGFKRPGDHPSVVTVNMTKRPAAWREWIGDREAAVKKSLESAGIPEGRRAPAAAGAKASKGMILLTVKRGPK